MVHDCRRNCVPKASHVLETTGVFFTRQPQRSTVTNHQFPPWTCPQSRCLFTWKLAHVQSQMTNHETSPNLGSGTTQASWKCLEALMIHTSYLSYYRCPTCSFCCGILWIIMVYLSTLYYGIFIHIWGFGGGQMLVNIPYIKIMKDLGIIIWFIVMWCHVDN